MSDGPDADMGDHPFERFGSRSFQDLCSDLLTAEFGLIFTPMGSGRDGGRDLYTHDPVVWGSERNGESFRWTGYTVVQVKQKEVVDAQAAKNTDWLTGEIRKELEKWNSGSDNRTPLPRQILFITNVPLTAPRHNGGNDAVQNAIEAYLAIKRDRKEPAGRIESVRVWNRRHLNTLVAAHSGVRQQHDAFLTIGDVLSSIRSRRPGLHHDEIEPAIRAYTRDALRGDGWVYFAEAGASNGDKAPLSDVAIDLPVVGSESHPRSTVLAEVLQQANESMRRSRREPDQPRHMLIAGAPGNGKTTIAKLIVQAFRTSFLDGDSLTARHEEIRSGINQALARLGFHSPGYRRWPIRVDLAEYVDKGRHSQRLLRSLAEIISLESEETITAGNLRRWLECWPWLIVFDGLDEVADPKARKKLIEDIDEFVTMCDAADSDALAIVTTRPAGYEDELPGAEFRRVDLDYLTTEEALAYGEVATRARLSGDPARVAGIVEDLKSASRDSNLQLLLRTPLQVAMLSLILEGGQPPADRYGLFWEFYTTLLRRERHKPTGFAKVLRTRADIVNELHERIGFVLQVKSELAGGSKATLGPEVLERVLRDQLRGRGFDLDGVDADLVEAVTEAGHKRLLLIAPQRGEELGFDIRSFQELMAARYLSPSNLSTMLHRMRVAALSPHWRNAWSFAAGRVFSDYDRDTQVRLIQMVESLDDQDHSRLTSVHQVAPEVALELVDQEVAASFPSLHDRLVVVTTRALELPRVANRQSLARVWIAQARKNPTSLSTVREALTSAMSGSVQQERVAQSVVLEIERQTRDRGYLASVMALGSVRRTAAPPVSSDAAGLSLKEVETLLVGLAPGPDGQEKLRRAFAAIAGDFDDQDAATDAVSDVLLDDQLAEILDTGLGELSGESGAAILNAFLLVNAGLLRRPVGQALDSGGLLHLAGRN